MKFCQICSCTCYFFVMEKELDWMCIVGGRMSSTSYSTSFNFQMSTNKLKHFIVAWINDQVGISKHYLVFYWLSSLIVIKLIRNHELLFTKQFSAHIFYQGWVFYIFHRIPQGSCGEKKGKDFSLHHHRFSRSSSEMFWLLNRSDRVWIFSWSFFHSDEKWEINWIYCII